jgi:hypothetical protein
MLPQMFKEAFERELLTPHQLYEMKLTLPSYCEHRCTAFLQVLLQAEYGSVIEEEEDRIVRQAVQRSNAGLLGVKI